MFVSAPPVVSLIRVMWYSDGPGNASNCHPKSDPQNSFALAVSSAGISMCTISPAIHPPSHDGSAEAVLRRCRPVDLSGHANSSPAPSSALLLPSGEELELVEVDGLSAGSAAAVPTAQHRLEKSNRLRQCQAGRSAFGQSRSSVRKACAQVTSAQWWWKPG